MPVTQELLVRYSSWGAMQRDCQQQISRQGLFLKTEVKFAQFALVALRIQTPGGEEIVLAGEVVQAMPGKGLAVQFGKGSAAQIERLKAACGEQAPGSVAENDPVVSLAAAPGAAGENDAPESPQALFQVIEAMSVDEKRRNALHGRKEMRTLLIRDRNKTVHPFVIKNPGITLDEIEQIAKMPGVNPDVLRMIAMNLEWTRSPTVCRNLVHNPKTPLREAVQLLPKLPMGEVRQLAKSPHVRSPIQQAARKIIGL